MLRYKINQFFVGRNGQDQLGIFLLVVAIILSFVQIWVFKLLCFILLGYTIFRMLSKNIYARRRENIAFLKIWNKVKRPFNGLKAKYEQRKFYKVFICPKCRQKLRVPRYKGKVKVKCNKCGYTFIRKT